MNRKTGCCKGKKRVEFSENVYNRGVLSEYQARICCRCGSVEIVDSRNNIINGFPGLEIKIRLLRNSVLTGKVLFLPISENGIGMVSKGVIEGNFSFGGTQSDFATVVDGNLSGFVKAINVFEAGDMVGLSLP